MRSNLLFFIFLFFHSYIKCQTLNPKELTVEYVSEPMAIETTKPRLAWILEPILNADFTVPKNISQTAYQIIVASDENLLKAGSPDIWDTKKFMSDNTIDVEYQGPEIKPGQRVFWTVRVWDQNDQVSGFARVSITKKILNQSDF